MNIRLTESQCQGILLALKKHIKKTPIELYLYGSRTQLEKKGGDIDLLVLFDSLEDKMTILKIKHVILSDMKKNIGDQKIDLFLATKEELASDEFLKVIFPTAVLIGKS
jgi:hypothetical protein